MTNKPLLVEQDYKNTAQKVYQRASTSPYYTSNKMKIPFTLNHRHLLQLSADLDGTAKHSRKDESGTEVMTRINASWWRT